MPENENNDTGQETTQYDFMTKENQLNNLAEYNKGKQAEINKIMAGEGTKATDQKEEEAFYKTLRANGIFQKSDMDFNNQFYRIPRNDPYNYVDGAREYIFITKVDLPLLAGGKNDNSKGELAQQVTDIPYFNMLWTSGKGYKESVFSNLCKSMELPGKTYKSPFINILSNRKTSNLDIPDLTVEAVETNINAHGTRIFYPGSSAKSDEDIDFTLEFEDTPNLDIYHLFKAYDLYRKYKKEGALGPGIYIEQEFTKNYHKKEYMRDPTDDERKNKVQQKGYIESLLESKSVRNYEEFAKNNPMWAKYASYIENKILYDHFGLYKFLVANDGYTILFGYKIIGFYPSLIPRSSFSEIPQGGPLKLSVGFKVSGWVEDSDLGIISSEFNATVLDSIGIPWMESKNSPYYANMDGSVFEPFFQSDDLFTGISQDGVDLPFIRRAPEEVNGYRPYYLMWFNRK